MIYLDNAATSVVKPVSVAKAVYETLAKQAYGNPSRGSHEFSVNAYTKVAQCRADIQKLFNVPTASLVTFTNNATEALNFAIHGLLTKGDHVIATVLDHNSVLRPIYDLASIGVEHDFVGLNTNGELDYSQFEQLLRPNTKMVVCTHASNVTGELLDINRISKFCRAHHLLFVVDVAQSAGVVPIDMQKSKIDIICFTGHKSLFGPQGTGGLCLRKAFKMHPLIAGGSGVDSFNHDMPAVFPERLEAGTLNVPGIAGLDAGVRYVLTQGVAKLGQRGSALAQRFIKPLQQQPKIILYRREDRPHVGTVGLNIKGLNSADVGDMLATQYQIATRPGAHCAPLVHESLNTKEQGIVRFSFSSFNTESDADKASQAVLEIAKLMNTN